jgi:hypothetical protein
MILGWMSLLVYHNIHAHVASLDCMWTGHIVLVLNGEHAELIFDILMLCLLSGYHGGCWVSQREMTCHQLYSFLKRYPKQCQLAKIANHTFLIPEEWCLKNSLHLIKIQSERTLQTESPELELKKRGSYQWWDMLRFWCQPWQSSVMKTIPRTVNLIGVISEGVAVQMW